MTENSYKLINLWEVETLPLDLSFEERNKKLDSQSVITAKGDFALSSGQTIAPMSFREQLIVTVLWFFFFSMLTVFPFVVLAILYIWPPVGVAIIALCIGITSIPINFAPHLCFHYLTTLNLKYFSYRAIWKSPLPKGSYIGVQPPHGLFPFGSMLALFAMPRLLGMHMRGAAASYIVYYPLIGSLMRLIGCIDASRSNLNKHLDNGEFIGVSTGGIAEIFETASDGKTECIILKSRGGVCKLALRHGVPIVPGYLFGNTQALTPHYDGYGVMQWLARKLKVPLCFFTGRFFLPIPHRTPLLCVFGDVIPVSKVDDPSPEQIQALLTTLQEKIKEVFDEHKATYGWPDVQLIIK